MRATTKQFLIPVLLFAGNLTCCAQNYNLLGQTISNNINTVTSAVPFLLIPSDARANGMGDAGVASSPDANSAHWNPAKLAFIRDTLGFSVSYAPWLRQLVPDINLAYLSWFYKLHHNQAIGGSIRYFSLTNIQSYGGATPFNPKEFALDFTYSGQLSSLWSLALSARYIYSEYNGTGLSYGNSVHGVYAYPGTSLSVDVSSYYHSHEIKLLSKPSFLSAGICISNIGSKISYSNTVESEFLPTNLCIGTGYTVLPNEHNKLSLLLDFNKLLVPTPPLYLNNIYGSPTNVILAGKDPNVSAFQGVIQSFYDAPGGFREELHEITISSGIEYWYDNQFALRSGFFYESVTKGGREYFTFGAGFKLNIISIDAAYIIPVEQQNPLKNTICISLACTIH